MKVQRIEGLFSQLISAENDMINELMQQWPSFCRIRGIPDTVTLTIGSKAELDEFKGKAEIDDTFDAFTFNISEDLILYGYYWKTETRLEFLISLNDIPIFTCQNEAVASLIDTMEPRIENTDKQRFVFQNFIFVYLSLLENWQRHLEEQNFGNITCLCDMTFEFGRACAKLFKKK